MEQTRSAQDFITRLREYSIEIYFRLGIATGITFGNKKYRFKRLGIDGQDFDIMLQYGSMRLKIERE